MAEVAGLVLGAITLPTIFSSCLELADKISDARNLGRAYEDAYTKHLLLSVRLRNCGTKYRFLQQTQPAPDSECFLESEAVRRAICHIYRLLEETYDLQNRYRGIEEHRELVQSPARQAPIPWSFQETATALNKTSELRQRTMPFHRKVSWTMYDKKALEDLLKQFESYIEQLEKLAEARQSELPTPAVLGQNMLSAQTQIAGSSYSGKNPHETPRLLQAGESSGHTYSQNIISGRARVRQGDIGYTAQVSARTHVYVGNNITGDARVLQGNTSGADMSSFWND